jgi:hypothetical protein
MGLDCAPSDNPYAAMIELCRRPLVYRALVLSLQGLYREELQLISTVKKRFPHIDVWLAHTDGRQSTLAEALRAGADGLLDDAGLHSISDGQVSMVLPRPTRHSTPSKQDNDISSSPDHHGASSAVEDPFIQGATEPILTADEMRALLQDDEPMTDVSREPSP